MDSRILGEKYDKIAQWWQDQHHNSEYGVKQLNRALAFCSDQKKQVHWMLVVGQVAGLFEFCKSVVLQSLVSMSRQR